jgi:hypothetical protein
MPRIRVIRLVPLKAFWCCCAFPRYAFKSAIVGAFKTSSANIFHVQVIGVKNFITILVTLPGQLNTHSYEMKRRHNRSKNALANTTWFIYSWLQNLFLVSRILIQIKHEVSEFRAWLEWCTFLARAQILKSSRWPQRGMRNTFQFVCTYIQKLIMSKQ